VELHENGHDLLAALAVQRSSRFIGQDDRPAVHERAGDADALLLAARELVGMVLQPVAQAEFSQQVTGVCLSLSDHHASVNGWDFRVLDGI
jgi:hypothetical protein